MVGNELIESVSRELGAVVGALLAVEMCVEPVSAPVDECWRVLITVTGRLQGSLVLRFDAEASRMVARSIMGVDAPPPDPAVAETLQELCAQALTTVRRSTEAAGVTLNAGSAEAESGPSRSAVASPLVFSVRPTGPDTASVLTFAVGASLKEIRRPGTPEAPHLASASPGRDRNFDVVLDIELPLTVRFGETELTFDELARIGPGSVIDLARAPDDPVEVLVNDRVVARGEVVVAGGHYGVRIIEVLSSSERMRSVAS